MVTHPLWRPFRPVANAERQSGRIARRQTPPGPFSLGDDEWRRRYGELARLIVRAIPDQVLDIDHVGSTAIPGLLAKPVIDIDLTVPAAEDEQAYVPRLEAAGWRLIFRDDVGGDRHRHLTFADPNANLHVWTPGAVEPQRHALFTRWLRDHPDDRDRYAAAKLAATGSDAARLYNDLKSPVVYDIYERAFDADPAHRHDPQPRRGLAGPAPQITGPGDD